jgi:FAD/FMN-containing dehydrogenase
MSAPLPSALLERLRAIVGPRGCLEVEADQAPYLRDERDLYRGRAVAVVRPRTTAEVAAIVTACAEARVGIVPQGGNTGYVGGSVPGEDGTEVLVSLSRLNRIRDIDALNYTMTVEAGCVLAEVQRAAREAGRLFPLSLAAEGSCQIGGNLSTNAGGTAVLRYGNARDLVLGLEVVLPDGSVWDGLRRLRKDNTGYDLKQLLLGAEGTLGIITAAVLALHPLPSAVATALVAVPDPRAATRLLATLRSASGDQVTTFEYLQRRCLELVFAHIEGSADPLPRPYGHYVLAELSGGGEDGALAALLEEVLAEAFEAGLALDGVVAASREQRARLWGLRETVPEAQKRAGACLKHDISVPVSRVPELIERATGLVEAALPGARVVAFGHVGDGNVHFNLSQAHGSDPEPFLARGPDVARQIHDLAAELGGSFSAEHGVGRLKRPELERYRGGVEHDLLRAVKGAFDPLGIMNPGKVVDPPRR